MQDKCGLDGGVIEFGQLNYESDSDDELFVPDPSSSYTMEGEKDNLGLMPRALDQVFKSPFALKEQG